MALETAGQRQPPAILGSVIAWGFNLFCQNVSITEQRGPGLRLLRGKQDLFSLKELNRVKNTLILWAIICSLKFPQPSWPCRKIYKNKVFNPLFSKSLLSNTERTSFHWGGKPERDHARLAALATPIGCLGHLHERGVGPGLHGRLCCVSEAHWWQV